MNPKRGGRERNPTARAAQAHEPALPGWTAGGGIKVRGRSEHPHGSAALRRLCTRARAYLEALGRKDAELSILVVGDRRIRVLNRRYRDMDVATDVLSFPLSEPPGSGPWLGDVVISLETARRRSRVEKRPIGLELDRYLAHGLLHLIGFDHERSADAKLMAEREEKLVRGDGLVGAMLRQGRERTGAGKRWTRTQISISIPNRSGSTGRGTRATSSRRGSAR